MRVLSCGTAVSVPRVQPVRNDTSAACNDLSLSVGLIIHLTGSPNAWRQHACEAADLDRDALRRWRPRSAPTEPEGDKELIAALSTGRTGLRLRRLAPRPSPRFQPPWSASPATAAGLARDQPFLAAALTAGGRPCKRVP